VEEDATDDERGAEAELPVAAPVDADSANIPIASQ
jgi:hypothetical protein